MEYTTMSALQNTLSIAFAAILTFGSIIGLGVLFPEETSAQTNETVSIEIRTIYATTDPKGIDNKLKPLKGKLTKAFSNYGTFKELARHETSLREGSAYEFSIPGGTRLIITHKGEVTVNVDKTKDPQALIKLGLSVDKKFNSSVRASRGSTFFQAGLPHGSGILILAITVR